MTNRERLALADRVQLKIQKQFLKYRLVRRKEQIEKALKADSNS